MAKAKKNKKQNEDVLTEQEQLAQTALGNIQDTQSQIDSGNELLTTPKTSGSGGNLSSAAPHSLIVHEDTTGEDRYEQGSVPSSDEKE